MALPPCGSVAWLINRPDRRRMRAVRLRHGRREVMLSLMRISSAGSVTFAVPRNCTPQPAHRRAMNSIFPSGRVSRITVAAFSAVPSRDIRPALANEFAASRLKTRLTTRRLFAFGYCSANSNESDEPQMSAPAPSTVRGRSGRSRSNMARSRARRCTYARNLDQKRWECFPSRASDVSYGWEKPPQGAPAKRSRISPPGSSEIGYSLRVRRALGAGSRSALPLRFSVIFEYGGLIP